MAVVVEVAASAVLVVAVASSDVPVVGVDARVAAYGAVLVVAMGLRRLHR